MDELLGALSSVIECITDDLLFLVEGNIQLELEQWNTKYMHIVNTRRQ